ncbi:unnamed protein product, partial [Effrenium voratum]
AVPSTSKKPRNARYHQQQSRLAGGGALDPLSLLGAHRGGGGARGTSAPGAASAQVLPGPGSHTCRATGSRPAPHCLLEHSSVWPKLLRGKKSSRVLREVARRDCFEDEAEQPIVKLDLNTTQSPS